MSEFGYLRSLFKQVPLQKWRTLLEKHGYPSSEVSKSSIKFCCISPDHNDKNPSSQIDISRGHYKCFGCGMYTVNPGTIYSILANCDLEEAYRAFPDTFGITLNRSKGILIRKRSKQKNTRLHIVNFLAWAFQKAMKSSHPDYTFVTPAMGWIKSRKIDLNVLVASKVGILPSPSFIDKHMGEYLLHIKNTGATAATLAKKINEYLESATSNVNNYGALVFPHYNSLDDVGKLQIRVDFLPPYIGTSVKFYFVTETDSCSNETKELFNVPTGFFGMNTLSRVTSGLNMAFITEGATDALSIMRGQLQKFGSIDYPVLAVPGTGNPNLDQLIPNGVDRALFCQDAPDHQGEEVFLTCCEKTKKVAMFGFSWPSELKDSSGNLPKDLDNAIDTLGFDTVWEKGIGLLKENFIPAYSFVSDIVIEQEQDFDSPSIRDQVIEDYGLKLGNDSDKKEFIKAIAEHFDLATKDLVATLFSSDDSERGFLERMKSSLRGVFLFLFISGSETGTPLLKLWDIRNRSILPIDWEKGNSLKILDTSLGGRLRWVEENVGIPQTISHRTRGTLSVKKDLIELKKIITEYLGIALGEISADLPMESHLQKLNNGIHYINKNEILIINGKKAFLGHVREDKPIATWKEMSDSPIIANKYIIDSTNTREWAPYISSIKALTEGNDFSLKEIFDKYYKILSHGWTFEHHEIDCVYLACLVIYSAIYDAIDRTLMTLVTANPSSGKTTLVKYLFGGKKQGILPAIPFFIYQEFGPMSVAGLNQTFCGVGGQVKLGCIIDEFEDDSPYAHSKQSKLFSIFRGMLETESVSTKGTRTGKAREIRLKFPVILAGVTQFKDRTGAVESRTHTINPKVIMGHRSPEDLIQELGIDVEDLTYKTSVGIFKHIGEIQRAHTYMRKKLSVDYRRRLEGYLRSCPGRLDQRRLDAQCVIAGILKVVGWSEEKIYDYVASTLKTKATAIGATYNMSEGDRTFNDILAIPITDTTHIHMPMPMTTLRDLLYSSENRCHVGDSVTGIRLDLKKNLMFVHWNILLNGVWKHHPARGGDTPERLIKSTIRNVNSVEPDSLSPRMWTLIGLPRKETSVFDISGIVEETRLTEEARKLEDHDIPPEPYVEDTKHLN